MKVAKEQTQISKIRPNARTLDIIKFQHLEQFHPRIFPSKILGGLQFPFPGGLPDPRDQNPISCLLH